MSSCVAARGGFGLWVLALAWLALCVGSGPSVAVADLVEVASVPGRIVDATPERVLYLTGDSPPALKIYNVENDRTKATVRCRRAASYLPCLGAAA